MFFCGVISSFRDIPPFFPPFAAPWILILELNFPSTHKFRLIFKNSHLKPHIFERYLYWNQKILMSKIQNFDAEHPHPSHHQLTWFHAPPSLSCKPISRNRYRARHYHYYFDDTSPASIIIRLLLPREHYYFDDTSSRSLTCYLLQYAQSLQEKLCPLATHPSPPQPNIDPDREEIDFEEIREGRQSRDSEEVG